MRHLRGARVAVVGMAKSGLAAVELLVEHGANVIAMDLRPAHNERLSALGIDVRPQDPLAIVGADLVVLSPGVPADVDVAQAARSAGVSVIGDLELASWFLQGDIIGITGANGKTTTTAMTGHILKASGIAAQVGGNIGTPPAAMVATSRPGQWNVLELSSFQLETTDTFRAHIAAALNVTPDHLDRHYTFENYAEAKGRIFTNQRAADFAVLNADDAVTATYSKRTAGEAHWFSSASSVDRGAYVKQNEILLNGQPLMQVSEIPLRGAHNVENTMAAAVIAQLAGATHSQIRAAVMTFPGVEHRLEFVRTVDGVAWYNDSKATNVDATLKAIAAFDGGLWIILGGKDKGSDYTPLAKALRGKARAALLIGAAAPKIAGQLQGIPVSQCGTLENAVREAHSRARSGDTVLLAPACASFDQFESYEHRGREFKRMAAALEVSA
ncbi:MAG: UDP-N-acetylmuramoyl-L-alanine--D-glutamate ligase [Acidobacteriota bacterium]